jgi:hypothetical protein
MLSDIIYSDDGTLFGRVESTLQGSYIARIWKVNNQSSTLVFQVFGDGVSAENWMLDRLECPLFTLLSK